MDTSKVIALKQELITTEQNIGDLNKQRSTKSRNLVVGIAGFIVAFFILLINNGESGPIIGLSLLMGLAAIVFLLLGLFKNPGASKKLKLARQRTIDIKHELVRLEHE